MRHFVASEGRVWPKIKWKFDFNKLAPTITLLSEIITSLIFSFFFKTLYREVALKLTSSFNAKTSQSHKWCHQQNGNSRFLLNLFSEIFGWKFIRGFKKIKIWQINGSRNVSLLSMFYSAITSSKWKLDSKIGHS